MMPLLASLCQQRGIDPNMLLAMKNNNGFGGEGGWFMWVIFLFFLMGWGGNGFGFGFGNQNGNLPNLINNDAGRELLMSAIQGNGNAIGKCRWCFWRTSTGAKRSPRFCGASWWATIKRLPE